MKITWSKNVSIITISMILIIFLTKSSNAIDEELNDNSPETNDFNYKLQNNMNNNKRTWQNLHGSWGKRNPYTDDYDFRVPILLNDEIESETRGNILNSNQDYENFIAEKRAWKSMNGAWGKRGKQDWNNFRGSWGKREPGWNNLKGLWGKRSAGNWDKLQSAWGK